MKNLSKLLPFVLLALFVVLACKNNPLGKFTKQYNCTIAGEPEPKTSEDYVERAKKHAEIFSGEGATSFDDCAITALTEAIRLDPNNAKAMVLRGYAYRQRSEYDSALADFDKAIQIDPNNANAYLFRSGVYSEKGSFDKAIEDLTKAMENTPNGDRGLSYLYEKRSEAYSKLGNHDLAKADEDKAYELKGYKTDETPGVSQISNSNQKTTSPKTISGGVLNGKAIELPKPAYPAAAKAVRAAGAVNVQVRVDEKGVVTSANAVSGHPLLRAAAVDAAKKARFTPTLLGGEHVKITGVIVYNFVPE